MRSWRWRRCWGAAANGPQRSSPTWLVLEFERLLELELPALLEDLRLAPERQDCLTGAISRLKSWMSGTLHWHETTRRYGEPTLINSLALCRRVPGPFPHGAGASEWLE